MRANYKERGMASLMVTTILMLVISLIVVGFSQVARRNQRDALDRQLSSQALYAVESGINAATAVMKQKYETNQPIPGKSDCAPDTAKYPEVRLSGDDVKVTCLLVDPVVDDMTYDAVTEDTSTFVPLKPESGTLAFITITWRPSSGSLGATSADCPSYNSPSSALPVRSAWVCPHGLLRVDLSPRPVANATTQASQTSTVFLYPHYWGASIATPVVTTPAVQSPYPVRCSDIDGDPKCNISFFVGAVSEYYLNIRSLYRDSRVAVDGVSTTATSMNFTGQAEVDVTAKAQDVLKRVKVRVNATEQLAGSGSSAPAYGLQTSESLCKRFVSGPDIYHADPFVSCN